MSITFDLPSDLEGRIQSIPDLEERVAEFLRGQVALEEWRTRRYSPTARAIVAEAEAEAERLRKEGTTRPQLFEELREAGEEIGRQLG